MAGVYFEKTVEWAFVKRYLPKGSFAAPLDGAHEAAGDALFSDGLNWLLIEFKINDIAIRKERDKFPSTCRTRRARVARRADNCLELAFSTFEKLIDQRGQSAMGPMVNPGPHVLVYGEIDRHGCFQLQARHYWGSWVIPYMTGKKCLVEGTKRPLPIQVMSLEKLFEKSAVPFSVFQSYVTMLITAKGGASNQTSEWQHSSVVGVSDRGLAVYCLTVNEFLALKPRPKPANTPAGGSSDKPRGP